MKEIKTIKSTDVFRNEILKSLSAAEAGKIEPHLEKIDLAVGDVLHRPMENIDYIYFPETNVISIVMVLENGATVESGIIGKDGFSGAAIDLTENVSPQEAVIQLKGSCYRLPVKEFKELFDDNKGVRNAAMRYTYAFIAQISQNAACLCHHNIDQRLARWLLMFADRSARHDLQLTQEFIAQMLGVHRPTVSKCANDLQKKGLISYNRGTVKILDRENLQIHACECYEAINQSLRGYSTKKAFA